MKVLIFALSVFFGLLASNQASAAGKVYKWTDEKGLVHYSERPPVGRQTEIVKPQIGHSEPDDYGNAFNDKAKDQNKNTDAKASAKDPNRCAVARKNLETLKTYARIRIEGEDGQLKYLTPQEKEKQTNDAAKAIEESCE